MGQNESTANQPNPPGSTQISNIKPLSGHNPNSQNRSVSPLAAQKYNSTQNIQSAKFPFENRQPATSKASFGQNKNFKENIPEQVLHELENK